MAILAAENASGKVIRWSSPLHKDADACSPQKHKNGEGVLMDGGTIIIIYLHEVRISVLLFSLILTFRGGSLTIWKWRR